MKHYFFYPLMLFAVVISACGGDSASSTSPTTVPNLSNTRSETEPTPVPMIANNTDWTPVIEVIDGYEMVLVPPGCFEMGSTYGRRDERPVHEVCIEEAFWLDRTEITNAQYGTDGAPFSGDARPRTNILWAEARDFCAGRGGRLPTEAEWEYAAKGPSNWIYPWGDEFFANRLLFDKNWFGQPVNVGSYPDGASWVGALDMAGNVWEFVSSKYLPYPYDATDGREDLTDETSRRVFRSGVYSYIDYGTANSIRFWAQPDLRDWFIGFRCAKDA